MLYNEPAAPGAAASASALLTADYRCGRGSIPHSTLTGEYRLWRGQRFGATGRGPCEL